MNWFNFSSWSINIKIFGIMLVVIIVIEVVNAPLRIELFNEVNRQALQQVVTESALRQKEAIEEDFSVALTVLEEFQNARLPYISVSEWLRRSDPTSEGFSVNATQLKTASDNALRNELLANAPRLFQQAWLIDADGLVVANVINSVNEEPRFDIDVNQYEDATTTPAHTTGLSLGQASNLERRIDVTSEEYDNQLSIQLVAGIFTGSDEFVGTLVVEFNTFSLINSNLQLSGGSNENYSFVASPNTSNQTIKLDSTDDSLINLNTRALTSPEQLSEAQSYPSGNRRVIGFFTPLFEEYQPDLVFVVELDEAIALRNVSISVLSSTLPTLLLQIILLLVAIAIINRLYTRPIKIISNVIRAINAGDFRTAFPINTSGDEIGHLAETVIELRQQLQSLTSDISSRLEQRTRDLQVTQEISRVAISETNLDELMTQVVNLIVERFSRIYHAQIFLIEGQFAVLKASTGDAGEQLLANGHRLGIGSLSVIGQVTQQNQTIIARDTATSEVHRRNEFLRDTRAELAIPMRIESQVIGVLDVQSTLRDAFDEDLVAILETMSDQITIAIENARLYKQSQQRIQEFEKSTLQRSSRNWEDFMYTQRTREIVSHAGAQTVENYESLRQQAIATRGVVMGPVTNRDTIPIAIPVVIRGQVLGVIEWEVNANELNQNQILLAEELAGRLAISLDNARLVQAGRQTVENERIINTISAKISGQTDIEQILHTAIQEVGQALRAPHVNIRFHKPNADSNGTDQTDNGHQPASDDT